MYLNQNPSICASLKEAAFRLEYIFFQVFVPKLNSKAFCRINHQQTETVVVQEAGVCFVVCMVICPHHFGFRSGVDAGLNGVRHVAPHLDGVVDGALRGVNPVPSWSQTTARSC